MEMTHVHNFTVRDRDGFQFYTSSQCIECGQPAHAPRIEVEATARPTPWTVRPHGGKFLIVDDNEFPVIVAHTEDEANVIVRAINQRQGLIDALRHIAVYKSGGVIPDTGESAERDRHAMIHIARAALKVAGEE